MPEENDWILYGPYSDKSLIRNVLTYQTARDMGWYVSRTRFCELLINDEYLGLYVLMEKIKKDKNRVDISKPTDSDISGGYILEMTSTLKIDSSDLYFTTEVSNKPIVIKYPKSNKITDQQRLWIENYINEFEDALYGDNFTDKEIGYAKYIDIPSYIDYMLISEAFRNNDAFFASTYMYKDKGEKLKMGPVWDFNIAMGNVDYNDNWKTDGWWLTSCIWAARLLEDPSFETQYKRRWEQIRRYQFKTENIFGIIDQMTDLLNEAQDRNFIKWPILGEYVCPNYFVGATYSEEIGYLKQWLEDRFCWMDEQWHTQVIDYPLINEINYNSAEDYNPADWIEILNPKDTLVDLSEWQFKNGLDTFIFPCQTYIESGEYLILCQDTSAFRLLFPEVVNVIGNFNFDLFGENEILTLYDISQKTVDSVHYNNEYPWPDEPDGNGPTLELTRPDLDNLLAQNWSSSSVNYGTPGKPNSHSVGTIENTSAFFPKTCFLHQNFPNPFNSSTTIKYYIQYNGYVEINIYNINGQFVKTLVNQHQLPGVHCVNWNAASLSSGIYFYQIIFNAINYEIRKAVHLK